MAEPSISDEVRAEIPEDLKGDWAQAQTDLGKPWHWMQILPNKVIRWIERIATAEATIAELRDQVRRLSEQYAFPANQRLCIGYNGECDGDLVAEQHSPNCPAYPADLILRPHLYPARVSTK